MEETAERTTDERSRVQAYGDLMGFRATGVRRGAASKSPKATKMTGRQPMRQEKSPYCGVAGGQKLGAGSTRQDRPLWALTDKKQTALQRSISALIAHPSASAP